MTTSKDIMTDKRERLLGAAGSSEAQESVRSGPEDDAVDLDGFLGPRRR
jgi:hypothetical protein